MFVKIRQWLRLMLLALAAQIGNLANIGIRRGHEGKIKNQRQLRQVKNDFKQGPESNLNDQSRLRLNDPSEYQLSLTGTMEPVSRLPTINLSGISSSRKVCCCSPG